MPEQTWKERVGATFISPSSIEHNVNGQPLKFYPISVELTFKLRAFATPIAKLFDALSAKTANDYGTINRGAKEAAEGVKGFSEFITEPQPVELAKFRHESRSSAITSLINEAFGDAGKDLLAEIIMDSLRDLFPRDGKQNPPAKEFARSMDLPPFVESLTGVVKANLGVFGPLLEAAGTSGQALADKLKAKAQELGK